MSSGEDRPSAQRQSTVNPALHDDNTKVPVTPGIHLTEYHGPNPFENSFGPNGNVDGTTESDNPSSGTNGPQWNANIVNDPSAGPEGRRPSSPREAAEGASGEELLRRLSLTGQRPTHPDVVDVDPRAAHPNLSLSGHIISATFCVPYKVEYRPGADWELRSRRGTSALFDSLSIGENVAMGLRKQGGLTEGEIQTRVAEALDLVDLPGVEQRFPAELSGGMRKRVGIARSIALRPKYLLYDEPTTGLDPVTSAVIDELMVRMREKLGVTGVVITHDMRSAYTVGTRIAMLYEGRVRWQGTIDEIQRTTDPIVRQFIEGKPTLDEGDADRNAPSSGTTGAGGSDALADADGAGQADRETNRAAA